MRVQFALTAIREIEEIGRYIVTNNPEAALRIETAIKRAAQSLETMPWRGRRQLQRNMRKIGLGKYPYNIFYHVDAAQQIVTIINIRHTALRQKFRNR